MTAAPVIFLMGPTATGKTDLAVGLVARFAVDIVSVDSALVYRGMDVGTAKPSPAVLARAPHRLVDCVAPTESYSAARFRDEALAAIRDIHGVGRVPLLVGGTGLYFRALEQGLSPLPGANPELRARLARLREREGNAALHARLAALDAASAARIHPNDPQRVQRAIEVFEITGRPMGEWLAAGRGAAFPFPLLKLVLMPRDRDVLRQRIARRLEHMLAAGLVDEVRRLRAEEEVSRELPSMRAVGYRQVWGYLEGEYDLAEMKRRLHTATARLAKRQMTWLRAESGAVALDPFGPRVEDGLGGRIARFLEAHGAGVNG
ncbi:MAG: tRNA (adenosine(37)-N6)-dimethylallyltransferase MiaA [Gammaproteobacteria bacterium]|nr:tRNA (adenosine(37)-N6)-dimethylallyltransferase MiaA [Gammaproteobacteria bacterium]